MKKFLLFLGLLAASASFAQVNWKFEPTDYRGAFAPAPTPMWTNGWANFDPQTTVYATPTVTVSANITANTTWSSSSVYLLSGPIYVTNNATLTIQPGTVIRGNVAVAGSALIITKGAKILAEGTLAQPIVFTSSAAPGSRAIGDWGGIVVLGKASNNLPANAVTGTPAGIGNIEGLPVSVNSEYGGGATPDDNDYSGILRYIRLEFGGYAYQIDKEINGFTFGSVGAATVAEFLQTSFVNDDAFEWFGGTMNAKYLVAYRCLDDDMDCDFGYRGKVQFGLIVRDPNIADQSSGSTSEGFECDNDGAGSTNTPKTAAMFSNFTAIGPLRGVLTATINSKFERALRLRRNSEMKIVNSIFMDWKRGLHIDGTAAEARAGEDALRFRNNIIAGCQPSNKIVTTSATFNHKKYVADNMNDTLNSSAGILVTPYSYTAPDYRPAAGSIALTNADFNDPGFPQFTATSFRGAFAPAPVAMWTDSWTNFDPANTFYPTATVTVSANITVDTRWTANNTYLLSGPIYVNSNATLTIEPGTVIRGNKAIAGSALVISKGAKLIANGTKTAPIVFTSSGGVGNRAIGDWGGIVILGKAANNLPANATTGTAAGVGNIEGLPVSADSEYGGGATPNDNDNSGILKYVRIEFGGYAYQIDKEINGLTMGSVGRSTVIDYVQTSYTNDDSFEWFGGTVNAKHLVAYRGLDDDMDCDFGYRGQIQYVLVVRDPAIADQSSGSTSEGFECDNDGAGSTNTPKTAATFSNVTAIGPLRGNVNATIDPKHERALRLRRNSEMKIHNSIFMDFKKGLFIDGTTTEAQATGGNLLFKNNILAGYRPANGFFVASGSTFNIKNFFGTNANDSLLSSANILTTPYNYTAPDYRPASGSLALTGASFTAAPFANNVACNLSAPTITGSLTVCQGSSTTLSAPAGYTYLWSTGATTQTITVNSAGVTSLLPVGSLAFTAITSDAPDAFQFVVLKPIPGNTVIKFTDRSWDGALGAFYSPISEDTLVYTAPAAGLPAGSLVSFIDNQNTANPGCIVIGGGSASGVLSGISASGDQIFALQGNLNQPSQPHFIAALGNTPFITTGLATSNNSYLPSSLTMGVNAMIIAPTHIDNGVFKCDSAVTSGTEAAVRASVYSAANWRLNDNLIPSTSWPTCAFAVESPNSYSVMITDAVGCSNSTTVTVNFTRRPTVAISGPASVCAGQSVTLSANGATSYTWGNQATTSTLTVAPTATTTYTVVGANASGCLDTATFVLNVTALPSLTGVPAVTNASCGLSNGVISNVVVSGSGLTYNWTNGLGASVGSTANLSNLPAGVYTLNATNASGCISTFGPYTITNPSTPPTISTNPTVTNAGCGLSNGAIIGAVFSGTGLTYNWTNSAGTSVGTTANLSNVPASVYNVVVTTAAGCSATFGPYSVANFSAPSAPSVTVVDSILCAGETIQLAAASSAPSAIFTWSGPNGFTGTGSIISISNATVSNSGAYSVTVTSNGCVSSSTNKTVTVNAIPTVTVSAVDSVLCAGETIQLTASTLAVGATYAWTGPNYTGSGSTVTLTNATAANAGLYSVTISKDGCTSAPVSKSIVVNSLPSVTVLALEDTTCVNYSPIALIAAPSGGVYSGSGVTGASFDPATAGVGTHVITYAYTDANACSNVATTTVVVEACVGMNEGALNTIRVFPNPTNTVINVASTREDIAVVVLTNSVGEVVARIRGTQLDASQFANGLYFVTAIFEDGSSAVGRVTILN